MKIRFKGLMLLFSIILVSFVYSQDTITLMSYNLLNYGSSTSRDVYFRTVMDEVNPDILVVQEILSQSSVNNFLNNVLNHTTTTYSAGTFINGTDTDNAIFYKTSEFSFISNSPISTALRDINEFKLVCLPTLDTLLIYSVHLKASQGSTNEQKRLAEVQALRQVTDVLPLGKDFIVCGDFNIYKSTELAYQALLNQTNSGYFLDPINSPGNWHNNSNFDLIHTQSPRTRSFGGGSTGGMDDRFDMILISQAADDAGGFRYIDGSYMSYGNDGFHFNDSINAPPNSAVSQEIADALHYASDHLPVLAGFEFGSTTATVNISQAWNLMGLPLQVQNSQYQTLFPDAIPGTLFSWDGSYRSEDSLEFGNGYWLKFPAQESVLIQGSLVNSITLNLVGGWNVISGVSGKVALSDVNDPAGIIVPNTLFYFDGSYFLSDTIRPGIGYWLKANASGQVNLMY